MRIAFYAPMKAPDDPKPSGDRMMARLLIKALEAAGHTVQVASKFSSRDGLGDYVRQTRLRDVGVTTATRLIQRTEMLRPELRPSLWFTYHLYHKAPDWIGPGYCQAMGIPYVVAEASYAPKQASGVWDMGHNAVAEALGQASLVVGLNTADTECVLPLLSDPNRLMMLRPFLDVTPFAMARGRGGSARNVLSRRFGIDPEPPWLLAAGMMREGDKLESYRELAKALGQLEDLDFRLIIAGDGPARPQVMTAMRGLGSRVVPIGEATGDTMVVLHSSADLYVWPAVNEAYGMSLLEAQATGVPVVAGDYGGVTDIVLNGETGIVVPPGDTDAFAAAVREMLTNVERRQALGHAAFQNVQDNHGLNEAADRLDEALHGLTISGEGPDIGSFGF